MAPGAGRRARDVQFPHQLGKVGRRTGITVPDSGVRDEHGLEPMDHLFSSPEKQLAPVNANGRAKNAVDTTNSSEEDMDVVDSTIPGSVQVLDNRIRASLQPPRSKSPRKTFLQSPARRNPEMGRGSSVDGMDSVVRQLDFKKDEEPHPSSRRAATSPRQLPRTVGGSASSKQVNGRLKRPFAFDEEEEEEESIAPVGGGIEYDVTDDFQEGNIDNEELVDDEVGMNEADENGNDNEADGVIQDDEEPEPSPVPSPKVSKAAVKARGRPARSKAAEPPAQEVVGGRGKGRGRPAKAKNAALPVQAEEEEEATTPADEENEDIPAERPSKRQKLSPVAEQSKRGRGRPAAAANAQDSEGPKSPKATRVKKVKAPKQVASSPREIIRQPPRPNTHSGLFISRRETTNGLLQTRSGRHSFKPIAHWRNERVIYEESEIPDLNGGHYNTIAKQSIAEIVRVDEPEPQKRARGVSGRAKSKGAKSKKRTIESDDEDEDAEPWESEPGRLVGPVRRWNPQDPTSASAEDIFEEIALSNAAIQTRDVPGSTFKFSKTVTTPFFGSGMVDLPVGGMKKYKNTRKMHMCFFVHYGHVKVIVHENEFRIGKGGMWNVPRGNFYSIENDYDKPARVFFAQACQMTEGEEV